MDEENIDETGAMSDADVLEQTLEREEKYQQWWQDRHDDDTADLF
jgi:hypothetical protein